MDNTAKDLLNRAIKELEHVNRTLSAFLKIANRPWQHNQPSADNNEEDSGESYPRGETGPVSLTQLRPRAQPTAKSDNKPYQSAYWRNRPFKWWKERVEFFAFLFAIGYAVITYFQWSDARLNFKLSQRPWVGPEFPALTSGIPIFSDVAPGKHFTWNYTFKNYGASPALRARAHARAYLVPSDKTQWEMIRHDIESLDFLPNSENTVFNGGTSPDSGEARVSLTPEQSVNVQTGDALIVLGGRIEYFDNLGNRHNTSWCIIYIPDPIDGPKEVRWHSCPINPIAD